MKHHVASSSEGNDVVAIDLSPSMPVIRAPSSVHAASSALSKRLPNAIPVRTEFVFCASQPYSSVLLCGDWCDWHPIHMNLEQGKRSAAPSDSRALHASTSSALTPTVVDCVWSVITVVPNGYREFFYMVDGTTMLSTKHPTNAQGTRNWRTVYGPPRRGRNRASSLHRTPFERAMDSLSDSLRKFLLAAFQPDQLSKRTERRLQSQLQPEVVRDIENSLVHAESRREWYHSFASPVRVAVLLIVCYGLGACVVRLFR
ncbi:hypothetical protein FGB62_62g235 [Gracilaria domingensis]|nr:hypothetical protein FGB62_62g235 [Gracilaria domingensis]